MSTTTTITLPGPPVAYAVEPARLVAWLLSRRWRECASHDPGFRSFEREGAIRSLWAGEWTPAYAELIVGGLATAEGIEPHALAALLATPTDGPALQWARLPSAVRADALTWLAREASDAAVISARLRSAGEVERANKGEQRANALRELARLAVASMSAAPSAAVAYIFRPSDGYVLSITRRDTGEHAAPGGKVEPGETPEQAMRRELREETGLCATTARLCYEAWSPSGRYVYAYVVEAEGEPEAHEEGTRVEWVPVEALAAGYAPGFHGPGLEASAAVLRGGQRG